MPAPSLDGAEVLLVYMVPFDGLLMRGINHPDIDRPAVTQVLRATMRYLLS